MSLVGQSLSSQREITVPAKLPMILKQFCKAAIRTQPYDLLKWSSSYFRALADGEEPPAKTRLEYPPPSTASGLTLGFLRVLLRQFGNYNKTLVIEAISHRWECLCLDRNDFNTILMIGKFSNTCRVKNFLAIAVGLLGSNLSETMIMICQLFTHEPDGGSAMIPLTLFMEMYKYLAKLRCDGSKNNLFDQDVMEIISTDNSLDHIYSIDSQDTDKDVNLDLQQILKNEIGLSKTDLSTELMHDRSFERDVPLGNDTKIKNLRLFKCCQNVPGIGPRLTVEEIASVETWMRECAKLQEGMVGPRNIRHTDCPSLHKQSISECG